MRSTQALAISKTYPHLAGVIPASRRQRLLLNVLPYWGNIAATIIIFPYIILPTLYDEAIGAPALLERVAWIYSLVGFSHIIFAISSILGLITGKRIAGFIVGVRVVALATGTPKSSLYLLRGFLITCVVLVFQSLFFLMPYVLFQTLTLSPTIGLISMLAYLMLLLGVTGFGYWYYLNTMDMCGMTSFDHFSNVILIDTRKGRDTQVQRHVPTPPQGQNSGNQTQGQGYSRMSTPGQNSGNQTQGQGYSRMSTPGQNVGNQTQGQGYSRMSTPGQNSGNQTQQQAQPQWQNPQRQAVQQPVQHQWPSAQQQAEPQLPRWQSQPQQSAQQGKAQPAQQQAEPELPRWKPQPE